MARIVVIDTEGDIEHVLDRLFPNGHQVVVAFDGATLGSTPPQPEQAAAVAKAFDVPVEMLGSQPAAKTKRRPTRTTSPEAVAAWTRSKSHPPPEAGLRGSGPVHQARSGRRGRCAGARVGGHLT